jgi:hypothetical protein
MNLIKIDCTTLYCCTIMISVFVVIRILNNHYLLLYNLYFVFYKQICTNKDKSQRICHVLYDKYNIYIVCDLISLHYIRVKFGIKKLSGNTIYIL